MDLTRDQTLLQPLGEIAGFADGIVPTAFSMAVAAPGWLLAGYIAMHFSNRFLSGFVHPPGDAQVDFGEAIAIIGGVRQKIHFLLLSLLPIGFSCHAESRQKACPFFRSKSSYKQIAIRHRHAVFCAGMCLRAGGQRGGGALIAP
ncbi:MAG: hypothetical protein VR78_18825 [Hoeflea sp. BRH_c9]|nr:MAG: hypothetical protein VR78_18825 [Hoeflea sp. BRH_c9]